ncbi:MAG: hypothetical protein QXS93_03065 [Candidatus Micrarchaeia archaeon]
MAKVVLAITRHKKRLKKVKYISLRLGRDVFAYPLLAKADLKSLGIPDIQLFDSEVDDARLELRNTKYLQSKMIHITVGNETFSSTLYDELQTLIDWLGYGACESEKDEFMNRATSLKNELEPIAHYLFDTQVKERIFQFFVNFKDIKQSADPYHDKRRNLTRLGNESSKQFKDSIMEILRKPRELEEIIQLTKVNESNARRWLLKLESQGIVTKTRKRMGIGRPKNIYYLSHRLQLPANGNSSEQQ